MNVKDVISLVKISTCNQSLTLWHLTAPIGVVPQR